ncbi:UDP-N-acetylmuramoyl-L-alanyl-D-glutamate synthetase [Sulfurovum lithotrophicum]|uniref:UDP-N-acetylmuramoylalanine--D-glutamate ligase n=1 Tax=Sulfurovum lithotrophicum TaxID=206403 RepID=A0A7U4RPV7_9BACT|nr:Mur ligase family protein [Sulfurovum lithotrophicum]AKF24082.1 UDP-N-acetylmuramoyl-L-alanyl-D-glutamate synthetase [Sulfurovum lithotrophicum]
MKPTLFGYGLTTKAIARKLGGGCTFFDDKTNEPYTDEMGNHIYPSSMFDPDKSELEVTTPSLKPDHPLIQKAKHLLSEYDYFLSPAGYCPPTAPGTPDCTNGAVRAQHPTHTKPFTVWISGTNGKTTTTQMLIHLLEKRGAVSGGNIGTPLADLDPDAPIWVLETSSFTLHHTRTASPNIYLLLPITPDHLDWHGTSEAYAADKLRPLLTMKEGELALVPKGLDLPETNAFIVEYDSIDFLSDYFNINPARINFKAAFLEDAMLALAITRVLFDEVDYERINTFKMDLNRQQKLHDAKGRLWVNDSKATNVDAAIQAIRAYDDHHIHLIAGGDDKGVDLHPFFDAMSQVSLTLYTIGTNSDRLLSLANEYNIEAVASKTLENAVTNIDKKMGTNDVALLSPAAASFDQFKNYAQRGEIFIDLVKKL